MDVCKALVNRIETFGLVDGPGVRVVVFLQGCNMRCLYCHNPETWGLTNSECKEYTPQELLDLCCRYKPYWGEDNGGVTFSGGEPLLQIDFIIEFAKLAKKENISVAIDTSGQSFNLDRDYIIKFDKLSSLVDLFIVDIKCFDEDLHKKLTGHSNKNIFQMIGHLNNLKKDMWIRHVLVPNLTDDKKDLLKIKEFLSPLEYIKKVEILPYHNLAIGKYERLGIDYKLKIFRSPTKGEMEEAENILI